MRAKRRRPKKLRSTICARERELRLWPRALRSGSSYVGFLALRDRVAAGEMPILNPKTNPLDGLTFAASIKIKDNAMIAPVTTSSSTPSALAACLKVDFFIPHASASNATRQNSLTCSPEGKDDKKTKSAAARSGIKINGIAPRCINFH